MKLLRGSNHFALFDKGAVATIGNFDGVHIGHQHLIKALRVKADKLQLPLVVILFEPQPREYFHKNNAPPRLSSLREKIDILRQCQVDYVYCIKFDENLAQSTASFFARHYLLEGLKIRYLLVGQDFRFGKDRKGDVELLKTLGANYSCEVDVYPDFFIGNEKVSSTKIREALQRGELPQAAKFLGRPYSMCGRVIKGDGRGRQWGIPTANLGMHRLSVPLQGVYVVQVHIHSKMVTGVANIGTRPTVEGTQNILEVHLFDFNESIYGELLQVIFLHKLRDEVKFTSVDALITQINRDITEAKAFLKQGYSLANDQSNNVMNRIGDVV
ncbi:FMN adenylyltransferase [Legionella norrlandica]|uniref:Riboflavin biosynthesis protein n=1 Tax=Legionella norrlandica TaxID=1498499 RepID=A0A0A2STT5_9GAMM|nr:bifunctional riboflavin kinase/FAD synthetase [Legionella norrlandica]KGP64172.1 FMN adenylyltransferase [Legionella norrlandica]